jgi:hypothetical protein
METIIKYFREFYKKYFEIFTEVYPDNATEDNPAQTIYWFKGTKRRKIINRQYTS